MTLIYPADFVIKLTCHVLHHFSR